MEQGADSPFVGLVTTLQIPAATVLRHLDPESRIALYQSSRACRQCALEAADQLTVTLLAHSGLSEAEWQRRRASAEQALAVRGRKRNTKLLLRLPTPNPAALQSILSVSEAAGRAVTELEVVQLPSTALRTEGIYTPWLQALPAAFPNLRTLRISHLCGCLPPPALLPHLRELHVTLFPRPDTASHSSENDHLAAAAADTASTVAAQCTSISPYLPQLTALSIFREYSPAGIHVPWPLVFTHKSDTLTHFAMSTSLTNALLRLLLAKAPALAHLECDWCMTELTDEHVDKTWQVKEIVVLSSATGLVKLPKSPGPVMLLPPVRHSNQIRLYFDIVGLQGLREVDAQCFQTQRWTFAQPPTVALGLPRHLDKQDLQTSIQAAISQLSALPAGSVIELFSTLAWQVNAAAAAAAIAAAAPAVPHLTVLPPEASGDDQFVDWAVRHQPTVGHARVGKLEMRLPHVQKRWSLQSFRVFSASVNDLMRLPTPATANSRYDLHVMFMQLQAQECTPEMLSQLQQRLQDWTLVIGRTQSIRIIAPEGHNALSPAKQAVVLRRILHTLSKAHWRVEPRVEPCVQLGGWTLTQEVLAVLACLPLFTGPSVLDVTACSWVGDPTTYQQLPSIVPPCYAKYEISRTWACGDCRSADTTMQNFSGPHIAAICRGAEGRMREGVCEKLQITVDYHTCEADISESDRSLVVACVDEERLGRWVKEVKWRPKHRPSRVARLLHVEPLWF